MELGSKRDLGHNLGRKMGFGGIWVINWGDKWDLGGGIGEKNGIWWDLGRGIGEKWDLVGFGS